jgi:hypothetical protein
VKADKKVKSKADAYLIATKMDLDPKSMEDLKKDVRNFVPAAVLRYIDI